MNSVGPRPQGIDLFWVSKVQILGAKGAENFETIEFFKEKLAVFL